jgi:hypothetical protein
MQQGGPDPLGYLFCASADTKVAISIRICYYVRGGSFDEAQPSKAYRIRAVTAEVRCDAPPFA